MKVRPDIFWLVTTQWRAQATGYAGDANARTPCLDALAAESVNYTQAVTPHPFGPFARAALLTGAPSPENGVRDYFDPLPKDARTIARALNEQRYATAFFGKWHLSTRDPALPLVGESHAKLVVAPSERGGFGFWEGFEGGFLLNDPWLHGSRLPQPQKFAGYQSDVVCARAANWWREKIQAEGGSTQACFAVVSLEAPHPPYDAPTPGITDVSSKTLALAPNVPPGAAEAQARRELAGYYAHIAATDRALGKLIATLDDTARTAGREPPIIVFTSVHGDMHGAHGLFRKGWPHEESIRVPLLVRFPDSFRPGQANLDAPSADGPVSLLDLSAMTLAWAKGIPPPSVGKWARISMPSVVALPQQCDRIWKGVRSKTRKLVVLADGTPWLYFDLERDPWELANLATDAGRRQEIEALRRTAGL